MCFPGVLTISLALSCGFSMTTSGTDQCRVQHALDVPTPVGATFNYYSVAVTFAPILATVFFLSNQMHATEQSLKPSRVATEEHDADRRTDLSSLTRQTDVSVRTDVALNVSVGARARHALRRLRGHLYMSELVQCRPVERMHYLIVVVYCASIHIVAFTPLGNAAPLMQFSDFNEKSQAYSSLRIFVIIFLTCTLYPHVCCFVARVQLRRHGSELYKRFEKSVQRHLGVLVVQLVCRRVSTPPPLLGGGTALLAARAPSCSSE
jgi:hypothetical protein